MSVRSSPFALVGFLALASSCAPTPATQLILAVRVEAPIPSDVRALQVEVTTPGEGTRRVMAPLASSADALQSMGIRYVSGALGPIRIRVEGSGAETIVATRTTEFVRGESRLVTLVLTPACAGVACDEASTCELGRCVDAHVAGTSLPTWQGALPEGMDANVSGQDAGEGRVDAPDVFVAMDAPLPVDSSQRIDAAHCAGDVHFGDIGDDCVPEDDCMVGAWTCNPATNRVECAVVFSGGVALFRPSSYECRPARGACDAAEHCNGTARCPSDDFLPSTTACRAAVNSCDVAEMCTGSSADCPTDARYAAGHACTGGFCNAEGLCGSCPNGDPCDDPAHACNVGTVSCATGSPVCGSFRPRLAGTICNASEGACDPAEVCNGTSLDCPDEILDRTSVCRPAISSCDVAEVCNQAVSASCPDDAYAAPGVVCRVALSSGCDVAEMCSGSSPVCPSDAFASNGTTCRAPMGPCDAPETCTGVSGLCPPLVLMMCDAGTDAYLPVDAFDAGRDAGRDSGRDGAM